MVSVSVEMSAAVPVDVPVYNTLYILSVLESDKTRNCLQLALWMRLCSLGEEESLIIVYERLVALTCLVSLLKAKDLVFAAYRALPKEPSAPSRRDSYMASQ